MRGVLALCLTLAAATLARAGEHVHTVAPGETLASLATQYYGSSWKSVYLAARNGLAEGKEPAVGQRLVVPATWLYKVRRGDSIADLARKQLGDSDRYKILMAENGLKDPNELEVGFELLIPFTLRHVVQPGESLTQVARRYYRTTRRAGLVKEYNKVADEPKPGDKLTIPIFDRSALEPEKREPARAKAGAVTKVEPTPVAARGNTPPEGKTALSRALDDYRRGELESACASLEMLLGNTGYATPERATIISHLGFCAVAAGNREAAHEYFRKWIELDRSARLDPILTSPKILAAFEEVAHAEEDGRR